MKQNEIHTFETNLFVKGNPVKQLLKMALDIFDARQTGVLYGTNQTKAKFLPTTEWDRGIMDKFDGRGFKGAVLKVFGKQIVTAKKLSPVFFYKQDSTAHAKDNDGMIAHVLRRCADYYKKGISVIICPDTKAYVQSDAQDYVFLPYFSYDGHCMDKPEETVKVDVRIVKQFQSSNSIYIYLPDYGILVINTAREDLVEMNSSGFVREKELKSRLDVLIRWVEKLSLVYLGQVRGKKKAKLLWRKEGRLRKASSDLFEKEKRYRDLYENAPIAYFSLNPEGRILSCNHKARVLSGYEEQDLIGRDVRDLFWDASGEKDIAACIMDRLFREKTIKDMELKVHSSLGEPIWVSLSVEAVKEDSAKILEFRAMMMDISPRKRLEKQLLKTQKMEAMGTLSGGIAHDFNNVLSPISGYTEMLLVDAGRNHLEQQYLEEILESVNRAKELVNQILTFSRQKTHQPKILNAANAVRESMLLFRSFLPATIKVAVDIDKSCGNILADPAQINQVMVHLITNAYHAMEDNGGELIISVRSKKDASDLPPHVLKAKKYICITITDTGTGIDPDIFDRIFDPYFSTKKGAQGSGVGLSLVHGVVESSGGHILIETRKNKGTRVSLYFPESGKDCEIQAPVSRDGPIQQGTERIILVDDDKKVAVVHTHMLEKLGYKVTCFTNSLNALQVFESNPDIFDLVITDLSMPDLTGIELAQKINEIRPGMPVVLCTGFRETLGREKLEQVPIMAVLKKPVAVFKTAFILRQILDKNVNLPAGKLHQQLTG